MKRYGMVVMAAVFVLALSVTAVAQYATQETQTAPSTTIDNKMVMGTVVSVSEASLVVQTADGDRMIFTRDASSSIPSVIAPGTSVHVVYDSPSPGILHVSNVEVNVGGSGASKDNSPSHDATSASDPSTSTTGTTSTTSTGTGGSQTGAGSETMPGTASPLPVIGLVGILALAGGLTIRLAARR